MNFKKLNIYNKPLSIFQKNAFSMLKGTVIAQFIGIIGGIYLAKIYGSESYGVFGVFISIASIFSIICTLQLEYSIVLTKSNNQRKQIISFLLVVSILITLLIAIVAHFLSPLLTSYISENVLLLGISGAYLLAQIKIFEHSLISINNFKKIALSKILITSFVVLFQLLFFYYFSKKGLIYGYLIGFLLVSFYFLKLRFSQITTLNIHELKNILKSNNTLIKFAFPSNLINAIANNMMPILIMACFSISESASYFLSIKILGAPLMLISNTIYSPYFKKATEYYNDKNKLLVNFTKKITTYNALIMVISIIVLNSIIAFFLNLFLGDQWTHLISYSLMLSFLFFTKSVYSPISSIVEITNKNHIGLYFNIYLIIVNLIAIGIGVYFNNSLICVLIISVFCGIGYLTTYFYFLNHIRSIGTKI